MIDRVTWDLLAPGVHFFGHAHAFYRRRFLEDTQGRNIAKGGKEGKGKEGRKARGREGRKEERKEDKRKER